LIFFYHIYGIWFRLSNWSIMERSNDDMKRK
jgi:hypothetical protein